MEDVLQKHFGFDPPRYDIIDKCTGSLAAFAEGVKMDWNKQSTTDRPVGDATGAYAAAMAALLVISEGCTRPELHALDSYLAAAESSHLPTPALVGAIDIPLAQLEAARGAFFSSWVDAHPSLVRALARSILLELAEAKVAVASSDAKAGSIDAALKRLQGFAWAVADNDGPLAAFFCSHVERWIRLCFFHAKTAIREWGENTTLLPPSSENTPKSNSVPLFHLPYIGYTTTTNSPHPLPLQCRRTASCPPRYIRQTSSQTLMLYAQEA